MHRNEKAWRVNNLRVCHWYFCRWFFNPGYFEFFFHRLCPHQRWLLTLILLSKATFQRTYLLHIKWSKRKLPREVLTFFSFHFSFQHFLNIHFLQWGDIKLYQHFLVMPRYFNNLTFTCGLQWSLGNYKWLCIHSFSSLIQRVSHFSFVFF